MRYLLLFLFALPAYAQVDCRIFPAMCAETRESRPALTPAPESRILEDYDRRASEMRMQQQIDRQRRQQQITDYMLMVPPKDRPFPYDAR